MIKELKNIKLFEYYVSTKPIKKVLSKNKLKHSKRVANNTSYMIYSEDVYNAALYHDFLEKGGSDTILKTIVSEYSYELIQALSHSDNESVIKALKNKLIGKSEKFINDIIIIKLADRADNLKRRANDRSLNKEYIKKSIKLIQYLYDSYTGDSPNISKFINNKITNIHKEFKKELIINI